MGLGSANPERLRLNTLLGLYMPCSATASREQAALECRAMAWGHSKPLLARSGGPKPCGLYKKRYGAIPPPDPQRL